MCFITVSLSVRNSVASEVFEFESASRRTTGIGLLETLTERRLDKVCGFVEVERKASASRGLS